MFTLHRTVWPLTNAFLITAGLIYLMHALVYIEEPELRLANKPLDFRWPTIPEDTQPATKDIKPKRPEEVEIQPELKVDQPESVIDEKFDSKWSNSDFSKRAKTDIFNPSNSQLVLALGFPPVYPNGALNRGIEGFAVVGFSVDASGHVFDAYIIESEPNSTFDKSALKAIKKFKYKAKVIDDKPVASTGQRYLFTYKID